MTFSGGDEANTREGHSLMTTSDTRGMEGLITILEEQSFIYSSLTHIRIVV